MADETPTQAPAPVFTENVPAIAGSISAIASASAPFTFCDGSPNFGYRDGIINISLEALRFQPVGDKILMDRITVAHLRMSVPAAINLRGSLDGAINMATGPKPTEAVN